MWGLHVADGVVAVDAALPANRRASFKATLLVLAKAADEIHGETSEPPRLPRKQVARKAKPAARKATGKKR